MSLPESDVINAIVARIFKIEDVTVGNPLETKYLFRYRGHLYREDTESAYDELAEALRPHTITPLFRLEKGEQVIYLVKGFPPATPYKVWINVLMFVLTVFSVMLTGASYGYTGAVPEGYLAQLLLFSKHWLDGWPFTVSLLAILLAHEFGHYFVGRYHKTNLSLPYFIPLPLIGFGTMGAIITMKDLPKNRRTLLDIGLAGPLAGLVVAIPVLLYGLSLSKIGPVQGGLLEGNSLLYLGLKYAVFGKLLPEPSSYNGIIPALYWLRYLFTASPLPVGGLDVQLNAVAWAGWIGLLITSMNLVPIGQLDGGHILFALLGKQRAKVSYPIVLAAMAIWGYFWMGWWVWAVLLLVLGRFYDEPLDQITQLDTRRKLMAIAGVIIFILVFIPVPLILT